VFIILQIFFATRTRLKIKEYIFSDIPQFQLGNIRSCDVFKPFIARERKHLMDYKLGYLSADIIHSAKCRASRNG